MTGPQAPTPPSKKPGGLAWVGTVLSLLACYGTLALVAGLAALGVSIAVNVHIWAAAIVLFALLAVWGVDMGLRRHGDHAPLILSVIGAALVIDAMYIPDQLEALIGIPGRAVEMAGFAALIAAVLWDWRLCKASRRDGDTDA
jgi:peptidoglycan/LPS O-acetylase OafA/YrhL